MNRQYDAGITRFNRAAALGLAALFAGCGGGGGGGGGNNPPPPPTTSDVTASLTAPASVVPGETLTYTATIGVNVLAANAVTATLTLPATVTAGAISDGGTLAGNQVTWPAIATLAAGSTTTRTVMATAPSIGPLDATLAVATTSTESTTANNTSNRRTVLGFEALTTINGAANNDLFGFVAEAVGDIDGDTRPDFIVGAPFHDTGGAETGRAYVYSGATGGELFAFGGPAANSNFGWSVAPAGDVDGDGTNDLIVGGPGVLLAGGSFGSGVARVYSGASGAILYTIAGPAAGSRFGSAVDGIGDVNGDGRDDFLVGAEGASGGAGQAFVYSGMTGAAIRNHTGSAGTNYGYGLAGVGDVSGDGVPDYAIGGGQGLGGRVEVRSGSNGSLLYTAAPDAGAGRLGFFWVDAVGDVNNDGVPDLFAGDIDDTGGRGRGYVFSGADGAILRRLNGQAGGDNFGISHNNGFDVDGDTVPDLFVAGYHNDEGANDGGKAYVFSGATGALLRTMSSTQPGQALGYDAVQLGDVDGDGLVDYLLTGGQENGSPGNVVVVKGTPLP